MRAHAASSLLASLVLLGGLPPSPARGQDVPPTTAPPAQPQNTRGSTRRQQIFSEAYSAGASGPYYVNLDSGVTYRVFIDESGGSVDEAGRTSDATSAGLTITPRVASLPPIRFSSTMFSGNNGAAFVAPATTGYKVETF